jgi:hypothetical protein
MPGPAPRPPVPLGNMQCCCCSSLIVARPTRHNSRATAPPALLRPLRLSVCRCLTAHMRTHFYLCENELSGMMGGGTKPSSLNVWTCVGSGGCGAAEDRRQEGQDMWAREAYNRRHQRYTVQMLLSPPPPVLHLPPSPFAPRCRSATTTSCYCRRRRRRCLLLLLRRRRRPPALVAAAVAAAVPRLAAPPACLAAGRACWAAGVTSFW